MNTQNNIPDISDHERWRLQLTVGPGGVRANYFDAQARRAVQYLDKPLAVDPADALRSIEDIIYDDPALLDDYDTSILIRPTALIFVPTAQIGEEEEAGELLSQVDPTEGKDVWIEPVTDEYTAIYSTPGGVRDFLVRSFPTEDVHLALSALLEHVASTGTGDRKAWVHLDARTLDIVVFAGGRPVLVNTREYGEAADAAYYIVQSLRALGLDDGKTELQLSGNEQTRRELLPMLREHLDYVSTALLPSPAKQALAAGISLCEAVKMLKS